jgi:RNA polymerase sigma-70 factor (ECF subfamily)
VNVPPGTVVRWDVEGERGTTWSPSIATTLASRVTSRRDAFAVLIERQIDGAYRLAAVILGDAGEAQDAAHDAALAAWRNRDLLRNVSSFEPWFTRIVVNVCRDRLRARRRHRIVDLGHEVGPEVAQPGATTDPGTVLAARDAMGRALAVLEPDELIVVVLRFYRDLPVDAIADRIGVPSGTVKSRLHNAIRRLRVAVEAGELS